MIDGQAAEQGRRHGLEDQLQANDNAHHLALTNVQNEPARLRDRLATADLRLAVLLAALAQIGVRQE